jgi:hypothetical protein
VPLNHNLQGFIDLTVNPNVDIEFLNLKNGLNSIEFFETIKDILISHSKSYNIFGKINGLQNKLFTLRITFCPTYFIGNKCYEIQNNKTNR